jgi:hypothetical protein
MPLFSHLLFSLPMAPDSPVSDVGHQGVEPTWSEAE